jgi:L-lactate dehydrogenase (cytochrome)
MTLLECQLNCPTIFSQLEVFVDGGVRRGADILKCMCLGATAVGMGRPVLYAVNYGQEGVEHAMALVGITDLSQCHAGLVSTLDVDHLVSRGEGHPYATGRRLGGERARL